MAQYGQADAIVGGNQTLPAAFFRALLHTIKPMPDVPKIFGVSILIAPHLKHVGGSGILLLADSGLIPNPTVEELAAIAIDTGKLAMHFLGRRPPRSRAPPPRKRFSAPLPPSPWRPSSSTNSTRTAKSEPGPVSPYSGT